MKFDQFPHAKRPFSEVLIMDWIGPAFCVALICALVAIPIAYLVVSK